MRRSSWIVSVVGSALLVVAAVVHIIPFSVLETVGFVTGALSVWLSVREDVWNWPIGIVNSAAFLILFLQAHLYGSTMLQVIFIVLGLYGWYWWLYGGENRTQLDIRRVRTTEGMILLILTGLGVYATTRFLIWLDGAAPFWDSSILVLSITAQFMLTKKQLENWWVWIAVDVLSIALYAYRALYLTSGLYVIFLVMCVIGYREWLRAWRAGKQQPVLVA